MPTRAEVPARELSSINFRSMLGGPLMAVVDAQAQSAMRTVDFIKSVGFMPKPGQDGGQDASEPIYVTFRYPKEVSAYQPKIDPSIVSVAVDPGNRGTGYPANTEVDVSFSGGSGSGAVAKGLVNAAGEIGSVRLENAGTYTAAPTATIADPANGSAPTLHVRFDEGEEERPAVFQEMELEVPILTMLPVPFIRVEEATIDFNAKINSIEEAQTSSVFKADSTLQYKYSLEGEVSVPIKLVSLAAKLSSSVDMKVSTSYQRNTSSGYKVDRTYSMAVHIRALQDEMPAGLERLLGILEDNIKSKPIPRAAEPAAAPN